MRLHSTYPPHFTVLLSIQSNDVYKTTLYNATNNQLLIKSNGINSSITKLDIGESWFFIK